MFTGLKPLDGLLSTSSSNLFNCTLPLLLLSATCKHLDISQPGTCQHLDSLSLSHLSLFLLSKSTTQLMIPANIRKPPETKKLMLYCSVASKIQPEMWIFLLLLGSNLQLTIDGGTNHAGESSEKCEQTKCRCEVVQPI